MHSIIKDRIRGRVARVWDVWHGAQATVKGVQAYEKGLSKVGDIRDHVKSQSDFLRDFGGGI